METWSWVTRTRSFDREFLVKNECMVDIVFVLRNNIVVAVLGNVKGCNCKVYLVFAPNGTAYPYLFVNEAWNRTYTNLFTHGISDLAGTASPLFLCKLILTLAIICFVRSSGLKLLAYYLNLETDIPSRHCRVNRLDFSRLYTLHCVVVLCIRICFFFGFIVLRRWKVFH